MIAAILAGLFGLWITYLSFRPRAEDRAAQEWAIGYQQGLTLKVYSTHQREEAEAQVMEQAIRYEASHDNELSLEAIKVAQKRLHEMTDAELSEAEEEMASLELSI